jgi:cell wall-associated NlpC family hydrolase
MDDYVGIPFRAGGRDRNGLDCWGLVRLVYAERMDIHLPSFDGVFSGQQDTQAAGEVMQRESMQWQRVQRWEPMDVLLMRVSASIPSHVGVYLGDGWMLHALEGIDSTIERTDSMRWAKRIQGAYRHAGNRQAA